MAEVRELRDTLDYCMRNEQALNYAIEEKRHDNRKQGGGRRTGVSKPTEAQAMRNLSSVGPVLVNDFWLVDEPERARSAISYTKAHFNFKKKYGAIYKSRYIDGDAWYTTCEKLNLAPSTYYDRCNKILDYAEEIWGRLRCFG